MSLYGRLTGSIIGFLSLALLAIGFYITLSFSVDIVERFTGTLDESNLTHVSTRRYIWAAALVYIIQHPLSLIVGNGAMNFAYSVKLPHFAAEHAHNDALTVLIELGVLGFIFYIKWILSLINSLQKKIKYNSHHVRWQNICLLSGVVGLIVSSLFESTFYPSIGTLGLLKIVLPLLLAYDLNLSQTKSSD